jgi:tRNA G37 N-methylase Trm5
MRYERRGVIALALVLVLAVAAGAATQIVPGKPHREPDVPFVPTHELVVAEMLRIANVGKDDVLYDLGSGDGRIVIAAARQFGTRGTGIEIDPSLVDKANENARRAGVTDRVRFVVGDIFETDFRDATVVTLYLLQDVNLRLRPKLLKELRPGTRVVSHNYHMGDWQPEKTVKVRRPDGVEHTVYFWIVPDRQRG